MADINSDGQKEIIIADNTNIYVFDVAGNELWRFRTYDEGTSYWLYCMATGSLNDEGGRAVIAGFDPGLWVLNSDGEVLWTYLRPLPEEEKTEENRRQKYDRLLPYSLATADLDGDGYDEIVAVTGKGYLCCWKGDGELLWQVEPPKRSGEMMNRSWGRARLVRCEDINDDGVPEIISAISGLAVHDASGSELWGVASKGHVIDIATGDVNGDGLPEIVIASEEVEVFSNTGEKIFGYTDVGRMERVALGDVDGDGIDEIIAGGAGVYLMKMS
ncbi:TPA: hypothetical protein EYP66_09520, partial [Candidatus Poribacteria bacterium]|nr:hypothetical protein [Candidatus Poribacteria bacterium]